MFPPISSPVRGSFPALFHFFEELHDSEEQENRANERDRETHHGSHDATDGNDGEENADEERPDNRVDGAFLHAAGGLFHEVTERFFRGSGLIWFGRLGHGLDLE